VSKQFILKSDDGVLSDTSVATSSMVAAIVAIELEHPGTIPWILRILALVDHDFVLKSSTSSPEKSIKAQNELYEWIKWFEAECLDLGEGGYYYAEQGS